MQQDPNILFLMSGQGCQYPTMGNAFIENHIVFRQKFDECVERFNHHGCDLSQIWETNQINETQYTQGALFAIEYASACFWQNYGITPHIIIGHSIGEIVAATFAGVMTLDEACFLVAQRSKLMHQVNVDGSMLAVLSPQENWISSLPTSLDIALYNASSQTVISGLKKDIEAYHEYLKQQGIKSIVLNVSHPFHSRYMESCLTSFQNAVKTVSYRKPDFPIIGNIDAKIVNEYTTGYWAKQIIAPVKFYQSMMLAFKLGANIIIECGPQPTLTKIIKKHLPDNVMSLYTMDKHTDPEKHVYDVLQNLSSRGLPIKI